MSLKDLEYPISYAIIEINDNLSWHNNSRDLKFYIVSKCLVLSEYRKYFKDGTLEERYEVFFPYVVDNKGIHEKDLTKIDIESSRQIVSNLYSSYNEAKHMAEQKNKQAYIAFTNFIPYDNDFSNNIKESKANHDSKLSSYVIMEEDIEVLTKELNTNGKSLTIKK